MRDTDEMSSERSAKLKFALGVLSAIGAAVVGLAVTNAFGAREHIVETVHERFFVALQRTLDTGWMPLPETQVRFLANGFVASSQSPDPRWQGVILPDVELENYRISFAATLMTTGAHGAATSGYSIAPRANVVGGIPKGTALQYGTDWGGIRYPTLPHDFDPQDYDARDTVPAAIDNKAHRWVLIVCGSQAAAAIDGRKLPPLPLKSSDSRSFYIRVWGGAANVRNITISKTNC